MNQIIDGRSLGDIRKTEDFHHRIGCPVCNGTIDYIGNLDRAKEFDSSRVKVDEAYVLLDLDGEYVDDEYRFPVETIVTCPNCAVKIKTTRNTRFLDG
jgi:hypothetical protein